MSPGGAIAPPAEPQLRGGGLCWKPRDGSTPQPRLVLPSDALLPDARAPFCNSSLWLFLPTILVLSHEGALPCVSGATWLLFAPSFLQDPWRELALFCPCHVPNSSQQLPLVKTLPLVIFQREGGAVLRWVTGSQTRLMEQMAHMTSGPAGTAQMSTGPLSGARALGSVFFRVGELAPCSPYRPPES